MRIGLLGPCDDDPETFREAVLFLLGDVAADQVVYLGRGELVESMIGAWSSELGGDDGEEHFLRRAAELAANGHPDAIEHLLDTDAELSRLSAVRRLPPPPARAVEMLDDRMVLFVHDKAILDEEDIANAHLIVYGRGAQADLRKFGRRMFFTPGPLAAGRVGVLEASEDGASIALYDLSGAPVWRESLAQAGTKLTVAT